MGNLCDSTKLCFRSLGVPREDMPQIDADQTDEFLAYLVGLGVVIDRNRVVRFCDLFATQGELNSEKVESMPLEAAFENPFIVSKDFHLLDGHHKWAKGMLESPLDQVVVHRVLLPTEKLLALSLGFKGVSRRDFSDNKVAAAKLLRLAKKLLG